MNTKNILIGVAIILVLTFGYVWMTYNSFVGMNEDINGKWAQVETQYQRRFDLIPNLVAAVKGAMSQEQIVFGQISEARTRYGGAITVDEKAKAASEVEASLGRLLMVMENYPQLKSNENVTNLMVQLEGTENRISVERKRYNDSVMTYNVMVKRFPSGYVAGRYGFIEKNYFEAVAGSENAPKVDLGTQ